MTEQTVADVQGQLAELQPGALFLRTDISEIQGYFSERQVLKTSPLLFLMLFKLHMFFADFLA